MTQIVGLTAAWHQGKAEGDLVGTNIAGSPKVSIKASSCRVQLLFMRQNKTMENIFFL